MAKRKALEIEACLTCPLCCKLLEDATTITLCLHTFCRRCINEKLLDEKSGSCPVCNIDLGSFPLKKLRPDCNLQNIRANIFPIKVAGLHLCNFFVEEPTRQTFGGVVGVGAPSTRQKSPIDSRMGKRPAFAVALDNPDVEKMGSSAKRAMSEFGIAGINIDSWASPSKRFKTSESKKTVPARTEIPIPTSTKIFVDPPPIETVAASPSPSLPLPTPVAELPYAVIWREGVPVQLSNAISLPKRFFEPKKYDTAELQELANIERYALKSAGLARALTTMNVKYTNQADELKKVKLEARDHIRISNELVLAVKEDAQTQVQKAEAARDKMGEELLKVKKDLEKEREDLRKAISELHQLRQESAWDKKTLEQYRLEKKEYLSELNTLRTALESAYAAIDIKDAAIKKSVGESFENALKQIQLLNPGITLDTSKMDCMSWVKGGKIVPLFPPLSDASKSQSERDLDSDSDEGEEGQIDIGTSPY